MTILDKVADFLAAPMINSHAIRRASEWEQLEADLIAITGSPEKALEAARIAVEAAKAGIGTPEQMSRMARDAVTGNIRHGARLTSILRQLDRIRDDIHRDLDDLPNEST